MQNWINFWKNLSIIETKFKNEEKINKKNIKQIKIDKLELMHLKLEINADPEN